MKKDNGCLTGKVLYDKKGATTLKNLTMKLHHIEMRIYKCDYGDHWHLATEGKHRHFRHFKLQDRMR